MSLSEKTVYGTDYGTLLILFKKNRWLPGYIEKNVKENTSYQMISDMSEWWDHGLLSFSSQYVLVLPTTVFL